VSGNNAGRTRPGIEPLLAGALGVAFLAITAVWLALDDRALDFDNGRHVLRSFEFRDRLAEWHLLEPYTAEGDYPPLVHLVGAAGTLIGGVEVSPPILAINLVFVPLLVAGLYGAGRKAFGPRAGVLAAAFGLACPVIISQFHVGLVDAPATALVAVSVWLLLESERFANWRYAGLAGLAVGLGMLTKQTFPLFLAGFVAVALLRGGWRHWRGLVAFAIPPLVLAAPWYIGQLTRFTESVEGAGGASPEASYVTPLRWTVNDFTWYVWSFLNIQFLAPLALLFAIGTVWALYRWLRRRDTASVAPELVGGFVFSYAALTYLTLHDPRYTLPFLVYVAVLGTGWIAHLRGRAFVAGGGAVGIILLMNTLAVNLHLGEPVRVDLWSGAHHGGVHDRQLTFYNPLGYPVNEPRRDDLLEIMRAAKRDGITRIEVDAGSPTPGFNSPGLGTLARIAGLDRPPSYNPSALGPSDAYFFRRPVAPGDPAPCGWTVDDERYGVYITRGSPLVNENVFPHPNLYCPPR
jgi:4-amino-4-deoxy-L-arabinose transferase-like glycosyltransferase